MPTENSTTNTYTYTIPAGYYNGSGTVTSTGITSYITTTTGGWDRSWSRPRITLTNEELYEAIRGWNGEIGDPVIDTSQIIATTKTVRFNAEEVEQQDEIVPRPVDELWDLLGIGKDGDPVE